MKTQKNLYLQGKIYFNIKYIKTFKHTFVRTFINIEFKANFLSLYPKQPKNNGSIIIVSKKQMMASLR